MSALYQEVILRHSRAPVHAGRPERVDGCGVGDNPMCGDHVEVFVARGVSGVIEAVGFEARGCAISVASADLMAGAVVGVGPVRVAAMDAAFAAMVATGRCEDVGLEPLRALAGVHEYVSRRRCALLPWQALMQAVSAGVGDEC